MPSRKHALPRSASMPPPTRPQNGSSQYLEQSSKRKLSQWKDSITRRRYSVGCNNPNIIQEKLVPCLETVYDTFATDSVVQEFVQDDDAFDRTDETTDGYDSGIEIPASDVTSLDGEPHDVELFEKRLYSSFRNSNYLIPDDEEEYSRLKTRDSLWSLTLRDLQPVGAEFIQNAGHKSPPLRPQLSVLCNRYFVEQVRDVLEVGYGTGVWTATFADRYPHIAVKGVDWRLSQQALRFLPPNVCIEIDNLDLDWNWNSSFDYIHACDISTSFKDVNHIIRMAYSALKPGGILELHTTTEVESKQQSFQKSALHTWQEDIISGAEILGQDWRSSMQLPELLLDCGFEIMSHQYFSWPLGRGGPEATNELRAISSRAFLESLVPLSLKPLVQGLGITVADMELQLALVRHEMEQEQSWSASISGLVVCARK